MLLPLVCVAFAGLGNALSISSRQPVYRRQNMSTPLGSTGLPSTQQDSTGISSTSLDSTDSSSTPLDSTGSSSTAITGVATFVMFPHQTNTVCGPFSGASIAASMPTTDREVPHQLDFQTTYANIGANGAFGAAAGSISPGFGPGGTCQGSIDMSVCDGEVPISSYTPPSCETNRCGQCYKVTNQGGIGGDASGVGQSITVQIIDACPAENAWNFCKTSIPTSQKCMDPGTNSLDIDQHAYTALTGQSYTSGVTPNLNIGLTSVPCP